MTLLRKPPPPLSLPPAPRNDPRGRAHDRSPQDSRAADASSPPQPPVTLPPLGLGSRRSAPRPVRLFGIRPSTTMPFARAVGCAGSETCAVSGRCGRGQARCDKPVRCEHVVSASRNSDPRLSPSLAKDLEEPAGVGVGMRMLWWAGGRWVTSRERRSAEERDGSVSSNLPPLP